MHLKKNRQLNEKDQERMVQDIRDLFCNLNCFSEPQQREKTVQQMTSNVYVGKKRRYSQMDSGVKEEKSECHREEQSTELESAAVVS